MMRTIFNEVKKNEKYPHHTSVWVCRTEAQTLRHTRRFETSQTPTLNAEKKEIAETNGASPFTHRATVPHHANPVP